MPTAVPKDRSSATVPADRQQLTLTPATASILVDATLQLTLSGATGAPKWSSSRPAVAAVSKTGLVRGLSAGTAVIVAKVKAAQATSTIFVSTGVPDPVPLQPRVQIANTGLAVTADDLWTTATAGTTDPDGTIVSYSFDPDYPAGGASPVLSGALQPPAFFNFRYSGAGTYTQRLTCTDTQGLTGYAEIQVVVAAGPVEPPANQSPIAVLTFQSGGLVGQPYTLATTGTRDLDGTIASYDFDKGDGTAHIAGSGLPPDPLTWTPTLAGTFEQILTVTDNGGKTGEAKRTAQITAPPPPAQPPVNAALPSISGTAQDGQTLTAQTGVWTGLSPITYTYQWRRCSSAGASCTSVVGQTGTTYLLSVADVGFTLRVVVTATNQDGTASATSGQSGVVIAIPPPSVAPVNTSLPTISGNAQQGQTLTGVDGGWTGTAPISYARQWQRCASNGASCMAIAGQTGSTYTLTATDVGATIRFRVTATNSVGAVSATSVQTAVIVTSDPPDPPPVNQPPVAAFVQQSGVYAGDTCVFSTAGSFDPDGFLNRYIAVWGDLQTTTVDAAPPGTITHVYAAAGTYTASFQVRDNQGLLSNVVTRQVVIQAVPPPPTGGSPLSNGTWPRLAFATGDITTVAARLSSGGEWATNFQTYVTLLESVWVTAPSSFGINTLGLRAMGAAMIYAIFPSLSGVTFAAPSNTQAEWGAKALEWILAYLAQDPNNGQVEWPAARSALFALDFAKPLLSSGNKSTAMTWMKLVDQQAWVVGALPSGTDSDTLGKWANNQFVQEWSFKIMAGLTSYGWGTDDAWAQSSYLAYPTVARGVNGWVTKETQHGGDDGSYMQGNGYMHSYEMYPIVACEEAWRVANGLTRAAHYTDVAAGVVRGFPVIDAYRLEPFGATGGVTPDNREVNMIRDYHSSGITKGDWNASGYDQAAAYGCLARALDGVVQTRADVARWIRLNKTGDAANADWWALSRFLGPKGTETSPTTAGYALSKAMQTGEWHALSGFPESAYNHAHLSVFGMQFSKDRSQVGHYQINYMGPSITQPGAGGHDTDAVWGHGCLNILIAPEIGRTSPEGIGDDYDDFGANRVYKSDANINGLIAGTNADFNDLTLARFLGVGQNSANEKYWYLFLNQNRTYNGTTINDQSVTGVTPKFASANRQIVCRLPATPGSDSFKVWVFDRSTLLSTSFQRRYLSHVGPAPTVTASSNAPGPSRGASGTTGKTTYTAPTLATVVNTVSGMTTKLWQRFRCPTAFELVVCNYRRSNQIEDPYGTLHAVSSMSDPTTMTPYACAYRLEWVPTSVPISDYALTSNEVTPSGGSESTRAGVTGTGFYGDQIGTDLVAFAITDGATSGTLILPSAGGSVTYRVLLASLAQSGVRIFTAGAGLTSVLRAADNSNALVGNTTTSAQGTIELLITVAASGTTTERTLTMGSPASYVGIPAVPAGLEVDQPLSAQPAQWPSTENVNCWYVDASAPNATDTVGIGDSNPRRGYPNKPRLTVPPNGTVFAAGGRLEIGGPTTMPGIRTYTATGTQAARVTVCGAGTVTSATTGFEIILSGAWAIVDGLTFVNTKLRSATNTAANNFLIRNLTMRDWTGTAATAMVNFASSITSPFYNENIVHYNLTIHDCGDLGPTTESDVHGIAPGNGAKNWWVLNCHIYRVGGDSVQAGINVGGGNAVNRASHIYIGGCHFHDNGENGVDVKNVEDLVISQCDLHDFVPGSSSSGEAVVIHEDAQRTVVFGCNIYNAQNGVIGTSGGQDDIWVVACNFWNIAHDPTADPTYDPTVLSSPGAAVDFRVLNGSNAVVNCTFDDCDRFMNVEAVSGTAQIVNNIFGTLKGNGSMVGFQGTTPASNSVVEYNLFPTIGGTQARVQVTTTRYTTLTAYTTTYPTKGTGCLEGNPDFVDAPAHNYALGGSSAALNVAVANYQTYPQLLSNFGQSFAFDAEGVARPQGAGWDMGAQERL